MDIRKQIANRIRALLGLKKITQPALAKEIGCTSQAVSSWCTGRVTPSYDWMDILCEYFKVPYDYFYTSDERAESILNGTTPKEEMSSVTELQDRLKEMTDAYQQEIDKKGELKNKYELALTKIAGLNGRIQALEEDATKRDNYIAKLTEENEDLQTQVFSEPSEPSVNDRISTMARRQLVLSAGIMNAIVEMLKEE